MKKMFSFLIVILFLDGNIMAQEFSAFTESTTETTTLFEFGQPLTTTEINFKNLFQNFPLLVSNSSERLKLLSYKFLTTIKNEKSVKFYVEKNTKVYQASNGLTTIFGGDETENNSIKILFKSEHQPDPKTNTAFLKELRENKQKLVKHVNLGDEVWSCYL